MEMNANEEIGSFGAFSENGREFVFTRFDIPAVIERRRTNLVFDPS